MNTAQKSDPPPQLLDIAGTRGLRTERGLKVARDVNDHSEREP